MGRGRDRMKQKAAQPQPQPQQQAEGTKQAGKKQPKPKKPKIGQGAGKAFLRQGMKELSQVLTAFPSHGVQPVEEQGTIWGTNPTPQEVRDQQTKVPEAKPKAEKKPEKAAEKQKEIEPGE